MEQPRVRRAQEASADVVQFRPRGYYAPAVNVYPTPPGDRPDALQCRSTTQYTRGAAASISCTTAAVCNAVIARDVVYGFQQGQQYAYILLITPPGTLALYVPLCPIAGRRHGVAYQQDRIFRSSTMRMEDTAAAGRSHSIRVPFES
ncbi:hypothetical protein K438DRAFT_1748500 [Mycena galopus ATCC 62051]|nr:hypothetical protein K438DRAFT_1748500 [Mycena galopus ATCC 62051]